MPTLQGSFELLGHKPSIWMPLVLPITYHVDPISGDCREKFVTRNNLDR